MTHPIDQAFLSLLGANGWLTSDDAAQYGEDWLKKEPSKPLGVARPGTTEAVAGVVRLCAEHNLSLTPQGGNTGLVLASTPRQTDARAVVLSLERLNDIRSIDVVGQTVSVEAGVVLNSLQEACAQHQLTLPMHLGSGGSAQIGGLISTNAGGTHAFRDGMMADLVFGLEVVLPSGDVWRGNRAMLKDNAGYPLRRLFCGAEGTLGVITAATLKLKPRPHQTETLLLACPTLESAQHIVSHGRRIAGALLSAAEFMDETGLYLVASHCSHVANPLEKVAKITLLLEFESPSSQIPLDDAVQNIVTSALENDWATDGVQASSEQQRNDLWELRESITESQRRHGVQLKHDVSVPLQALSEFISVTTERLQEAFPAQLINPFGHLADGNVHFNLSPASTQDETEFLAAADQLNAIVYDAVVEFNGSIAAEHGLGRSKVTLADRSRDRCERLLMKTLKNSIDPRGTMNPGVIVATTDEVPDVPG